MKKFIFIIFLLLAFCQNPHNQPAPKAKKGVLDLQKWDFSKDGIVNLSGEWEFYWNEFLCSKGGHFDYTQCSASFAERRRIIPVPAQWQKQGYPANGYATYRLQILLPEGSGYSLQEDPKLSIFIRGPGTAYEMYINGKLVSKNGKIGKSKEEMEPFYQHKTLEVPFTNHSSNNFNEKFTKQLEIIVYISNFHHINAGLWDKIKLGSTESINNLQKGKFAIDLLVFTSLFIMGLYHLGLFFNRKKETSPLYFGLFCLLLALRTISVSERIIMDTLTFLPFLAVHKIEYITFYYAIFVFYQFIYALFPTEASRLMYKILFIICIPASILVAVTPMSVYTHTLLFLELTVLVGIIYVLKVLIHAIVRKRLGAKLFIIGFIIFFGAVILDILQTLAFHFLPRLVSYGFLSFIFFQSLVLSRRFSRAFVQVEELSENLEKKVEERTQRKRKS